jgi:CRISPR/Cas system-associated exonuclease Cas4 (RecB family)
MSQILPPVSKEQKYILINSDNNIIVDAVAGSGKTTTILHLADVYNKISSDDKILLLTYNKKLKFETRKRIAELKLNNIEAHSYHSAACAYYSKDTHTDFNLMNVINDMQSDNLPLFNRIIIDEAQDMSDLYYKFICIIVRDIKHRHNFNNIAFMVLGDKFQSIFKFNGADHRYIQYADVVFSPLTKRLNWVNANLSTSYRITKPMADFINNVVLHNDRMISIKNGPEINYIMSNGFDFHICNYIKDLIKAPNSYKYDDIFILAPSVRSVNSPVRKLANQLFTKNKIPIYIPNNDDEILDEDVLKNKIVFSTFHQVKGLERKCVVVFGFDNSYYKYYGKNESTEICPNPLYVAITRASERLTLVHNTSNDFLSFLDVNKLSKYTAVQSKIKMRINKPLRGGISIAVTKLIRHLPYIVIYNSIKLLSYKTLQEPQEKLNIINKIESKLKDKDIKESVSEINGVALPAYFEYVNNETLTILHDLAGTKIFKDMKTKHPKIFTESEGAVEFNMNAKNLLILSNYYCAFREEYLYKTIQIAEYNWLTEDNLTQSYNRLSRVISKNAEFEREFSLELKSGSLCGCVDIIDKESKTLWEIKSVTALKYEHILQLALYAYMYNCRHPNNNMKFKLFNVLDNHIIELEYNHENTHKMFELLYQAKYYDNKSSEDDLFIKNTLMDYEEYILPLSERTKKTEPLKVLAAGIGAISISDMEIFNDDQLF